MKLEYWRKARIAGHKKLLQDQHRQVEHFSEMFMLGMIPDEKRVAEQIFDLLHDSLDAKFSRKEAELKSALTIEEVDGNTWGENLK